jgi:hypothetical protein
MIKKIPFILLLLITTSLGATLARASGGGFTLHPTYFHQGNAGWIIKKTAAGSQFRDFLTVENLSNDEQKISLIVREADTKGTQFIPLESTHYKNIGRWTNLPEAELLLAPHEKRNISFEIKVPKNAAERQYQGVIYAVKKERNKQNVTIVTRIGVRIYLDVTTPGILTNTLFQTSAYKNSFFFILSLAGVLGSLMYNIINHIENKKYANKHA